MIHILFNTIRHHFRTIRHINLIYKYKLTVFIVNLVLSNF